MITLTMKVVRREEGVDMGPWDEKTYNWGPATERKQPMIDGKMENHRARLTGGKRDDLYPLWSADHQGREVSPHAQRPTPCPVSE